MQDDGLQLHVAGFINTVHVAERGGDGEVRADLAQLFVSVSHILGLRIEARAVDAGVIDTVFLAAGDTELDFEGHLQLGHAGQILLADFNVLFQGFFGEVEHVGAEERLAVCCIVFLTFVQQTVDPREEFLGGVVGVYHHGHAVQLGHAVDVHSTGNTALDGRLLVVVAQRFAGAEDTAAVGELDHHRGIHRLGGFHHGVDGVRTDHVHSREGEFVFLCNAEDLLQIFTINHTGFHFR